MSGRRQRKKASALAKRFVAHKHNGRVTGFKLAETPEGNKPSSEDQFARWQSSAQAAIDFVIDSGMVDSLARKASASGAAASSAVPAQENDDVASVIESELASIATVELDRIDDNDAHEMPAPPISINLSAKPAAVQQKQPLVQPQSLDMSGSDDKSKKKKRGMGRRSIVPTLAQSDPVRAKIYSAGMGTVNAKLSETCIRSGSHALSVSVRDGRAILYTTPAASARLSNNPRLLAQLVNLLADCESAANDDQQVAATNDVSRYGTLATSQNARGLNIRGNRLGVDQKSIIKTPTADVALSLPISSLNRVSSFAMAEQPQQQPSRKRRVDADGFVVPLPKHASNSESGHDDDDDDGNSDESSLNLLKANFEAAANDNDEEESESFTEPEFDSQFGENPA